MRKDTIIAVFAVGIIAGSVILFYQWAKDRDRREFASGIAELSPRGRVPQTIEALVDAIVLYEERIENHIRDAAQTGAYWKILGIRLADRGMHRDAIYAFEQAIRFNAEDPTLFFLTGESAWIVATSALDFPGLQASERDEYFRLAESAFLRAIDMDVTYGRPRLSLGIMYAVDLDRPQDAIVQLDRFLQTSPRDVSGMFALARSHAMIGQLTQAIELYERILSISGDATVRAEAQSNINHLRDFMWNE